MYDQDIIEPFNSMGLINKNGKTKLGWNKWVNKNQDVYKNKNQKVFILIKK